MTGYILWSIFGSAALGACAFCWLEAFSTGKVAVAMAGDWTQARVRYLNSAGHQVSFTLNGRVLEEKRGGELAVTFSSSLHADRVGRMEHRDEALRGQGYVADCDWRCLFAVDASLVED